MDKDLKAISNALRVPFPASAIRKREGPGGKKFDYIEGHVVIHRLNDSTENDWSAHITDLKREGDLWVCFVELTIPGLGTRPGIGVQRVSDRSGEDLIKGALTDGIKHAAKHFGVAIDLYGPDREDEDYQASNASSFQRPQASATAQNGSPARTAPPAKQAVSSPPRKATEEEVGEVLQLIGNAGFDHSTELFGQWLEKCTSNHTATLDDLLWNDVPKVKSLLGIAIEKRKAKGPEPSGVLAGEIPPATASSEQHMGAIR